MPSAQAAIEHACLVTHRAGQADPSQAEHTSIKTLHKQRAHMPEGGLSAHLRVFPDALLLVSKLLLQRPHRESRRVPTARWPLLPRGCRSCGRRRCRPRHRRRRLLLLQLPLQLLRPLLQRRVFPEDILHAGQAEVGVAYPHPDEAALPPDLRGALLGERGQLVKLEVGGRLSAEWGGKSHGYIYRDVIVCSGRVRRWRERPEVAARAFWAEVTAHRANRRLGAPLEVLERGRVSRRRSAYHLGEVGARRI